MNRSRETKIAPAEATGGSWQYYHTVWLVIVAAWTTSYMVRLGFSPALVSLKEEFSLSYTEVGMLASAFFYAYTFTQLPAGVLGDRIGRRAVLTLAPIWWGLMALMTAFASSFTVLFVARFLTGVGQGCYFGNDRPVVNAYTPPTRAGVGQGVSMMGLGVGMALGIWLAGMIADRWGWRSVFVIFAIPSFVAGVVVWWKVKEPPRHAMPALPAWLWWMLAAFPVLLLGGTIGEMPVLQIAAFVAPIVFVVALTARERGLWNRDLWLVYAAGIAPMYCLWVIGIWSPAMFLEVGVRELERSSLLSSLLGVAAVPGLLLLGLLTDWLGGDRRSGKRLAAAVMTGLAVVMLAIALAVNAKAGAAILAGFVFVAGVLVWGVWPPIFAMLRQMTPTRLHGTSYGMNNTVNFIGSLVAPLLTGWLRDVSGSFVAGCYVAAGLALIGAITMLAVRAVSRADMSETAYAMVRSAHRRPTEGE
jgi:MFS family permease